MGDNSMIYKKIPKFHLIRYLLFMNKLNLFTVNLLNFLWIQNIIN